MMSTALHQEPRRAPEPERSRRRWVWVAVVIALTVLIVLSGGAVLLLTPHRDSDLNQDPALSGRDPDRTPISTKTAVFRGTEVQQVRQYQSWLGQKVDYIVDFSSRNTWEQIVDPAYMLNQWRNSGFRPVYSTALLPEQDQSASIEMGATGAYDHYFAGLGRNLVAAGQGDAILRLGWEFNLDSSRWGAGSPKQFVAYWRHAVAALRSVPGQRFEFDWNPNNGKNKYDAVAYYPGDDVVDYVGVDAYDVAYSRNTYPYPGDCDQACRLERQQNAWARSIYGGSRGLHFWSRFAAHHGKPMSLPEWGLWERPDGHGGGNDDYYLTKMHEFISDPDNDVAYQSYFEFDGADGTHRLMGQDFPGAGGTFRSLFDND